MFFLLNDTVLPLNGGLELVEKVGLPKNIVVGSSLPEIIFAMQTAIFEKPDFPKTDPNKAAALCWLINSRSQANVALFMNTNVKSKSPQSVAFKLGQVGLTVLGSLNSLQKQGRLSNQIINDSVWSRVG